MGAKCRSVVTFLALLSYRRFRNMQICPALGLVLLQNADLTTESSLFEPRLRNAERSPLLEPLRKMHNEDLENVVAFELVGS